MRSLYSIRKEIKSRKLTIVSLRSDPPFYGRGIVEDAIAEQERRIAKLWRQYFLRAKIRRILKVIGLRKATFPNRESN